MKILVTGGAGFIGSNLVRRLAARGECVVIVDDFNDYYSPSLKRANAHWAGRAGDVTIAEGDVRDQAFLEEVFKDSAFDCIVHLAARAGVRPSLADPQLYVDVNLNGTVTLLEQAHRAGVKRFVFASSSSVYGVSRDVPFSEDACADHPASPYGATKRAGEVLLAAYRHLYGLRFAALRFFTVYGPRQRPDMAIHKFVRAVISGEELTMFGDGSSARDYTYIDDIIDGVVAAVDADLEWEIINLGDSEPVTLKSMIATIGEAVGREPRIEHLGDQPGDVPITYADISKAGRLLGFKPKIAFKEGIKRFVDWYRNAQAQGLL
ncbi:MAG: SDR family NAD(P)-dependent oxidoreductase [Planctomycetes bacterium]|nr:SDR family NAD(P)-dependent oxidoreductase [Planctomycetota bacterium]